MACVVEEEDRCHEFQKEKLSKPIRQCGISPEDLSYPLRRMLPSHAPPTVHRAQLVLCTL